MKKITLIFFVSILSNSISAQSDEFNWDTVDFETGKDYLFIDTAEINIWHICEPKKSFFDSAYSPTRAIVTDSSGYYPINNHSFFDLYIGAFNVVWYPYDTFIEITHKFDTDTLTDGGFITVSCDRGLTWMNIINDSLLFCLGFPLNSVQNLYTEDDALFNGEPGFSGRSDGWLKTEFAWYVFLAKSTIAQSVDTMIIRFHFISDSTPSDKEGWMIDDIRLFSVDMGGGINNYNSSGHIKVYPNPVKSFVNLEFEKTYHAIEIEIFELSGKMIKGAYLKNSNNLKLDCSELNNGMYILRTIMDSEIGCYYKLLIRK